MENFNLIQCLTTAPEQYRIIWMCNIGAEKYWHSLPSGITDRYEDAIVNRVEEINLLICRKQDILILRQRPGEAYLKQLEQLGYEIPTILTPQETDPLIPIAELVLGDEKVLGQLRNISQYGDVYFVPYAVTPLEEQIAQRCGLRLIGSPSAINAKVNDKIFNRKISEDLSFQVCKGQVCHSVDEIRQTYNRLTLVDGFEKVIVKEPGGASGKGLYILDDLDKLESRLKMIKRFSRGNNQWLVEGWYLTSYDINYQIYISPTGECEVFSIKQQLLRDTVYIGSQMPPQLSDAYIRQYEDYGRKIGAYLYSIGYTGVAGVDSIITQQGTLIPIIEINGRFTLSTYLSFLQAHLGQNKVLARYFRLSDKKPSHYEAIFKALQQSGLIYTADKKEGVVIYASGPLSVIKQDCGEYRGRLFTLITAESWERVNELNTALENRLSDLFAIA